MSQPETELTADRSTHLELPDQLAATFPGVRLRPLTIGDAAEVVRLLNLAEQAEPTDSHYDVDDIVEEFNGPGVDLERNSLAVERDGQLLAYAALEFRAPEGVWMAYVSGSVDPAHRRSGLGRFLMGWLETAAAAARDRHDPAVTAELKWYVDDVAASERALAEAVDFVPRRWWYRMRRDLQLPVARVAQPVGVTIRPFRSEDDEEVRQASNDSFADHWGSMPMTPAEWNQHVSGNRNFRPDLSLVATDAQGAVIGFSLQAEYLAETAQNGFTTGWVDRLGVVRSARKSGVATALLAAALQILTDHGYRRAELNVDADSPTGAGRVYTGVGFEVVDRCTTYQRALPPRP